MKQKMEFTLEFHFDERTRWLATDQELIDEVRLLNYCLAAVHTAGAKPMVKVCLVRPERPWPSCGCDASPEHPCDHMTPPPAADSPEAGFCFCKSCLVYSEPVRDHLGRPTCKHCHSPRVRLLTPEELLQPQPSMMTANLNHHAIAPTQ